MKSPHWRSVVVDTRAPAEADIACHAAFGMATQAVRRGLTLAAERYAEQGDVNDAASMAAFTRISDEFAAPESGDPAACIGTGPSLVAWGVIGTVIGCNGEACEFELEATRTYAAFNGHRMTAPLQCHPRTGAVSYDYKGDPKYSQVDAQHAEDCPCLDPEEGDGGADFEAVQRWEFPGDYE